MSGGVESVKEELGKFIEISDLTLWEAFVPFKTFLSKAGGK
jgi:hypothetical protein